jgi:uncharacterized membrane protein YeaQ/YmgE (transglycosylase-associated protein family)
LGIVAVGMIRSIISPIVGAIILITVVRALKRA